MEINNKILISLLGAGACIATVSLLVVKNELEAVNSRVDNLRDIQSITLDLQNFEYSGLTKRLNSVEEKLNTKTKKSK